MAYNVRVKVFQNGTLQLTYYHGGIRSKDDYYKPRIDSGDPTFWIGEDGTVNDTLNFDPFEFSKGDIYKIGTKLVPEEEYLVLTEEELQSKKDRSLRCSLNRSKKMIYDYGRSNVWDWFITLTFKRVKEFNAENYAEASKKVRDWFKNVRKNYCPDIKYLAIPEQHESGAWHFHCLVSNCEELTFEKAINNAKYYKKNGEYVLDEKGQRVPNKYFGQYLRTSYPDGDYIYNVKQYKNGWTTATRIKDTRKSVSYVVKYMTEELCECTFGKRRYYPSNNLKLPQVNKYAISPYELERFLLGIEYNYKCKMSMDCIKTYDVNVDGYNNQISIFEFEADDKDVVLKGDPVKLLDCLYK